MGGTSGGRGSLEAPGAGAAGKVHSRDQSKVWKPGRENPRAETKGQSEAK